MGEAKYSKVIRNGLASMGLADYSDIGWQFNSSTGCHRRNCPWKHVKTKAKGKAKPKTSTRTPRTKGTDKGSRKRAQPTKETAPNKSRNRRKTKSDDGEEEEDSDESWMVEYADVIRNGLASMGQGA